MGHFSGFANDQRGSRSAVAKALLSRVVIAAFGVAALSSVGLAQTVSPPPNALATFAPSVSYAQGMAKILSQNTATPSNGTGSCGSTRPPEVMALAASLKNSPDLIYEWVYNQVDTLPQQGSLKGVLGTLIDRSGTAFDQAELMVSLLQQAGYCSASIQVGEVDISAAQFNGWLGTNITTSGGATYISNSNGLSVALSDGGFPYTFHGSANQVTGAGISWAWVQVPINGTNYVFDPATPAKYTRTLGLGGAGLASAIGYTTSTFTSDAKANYTPDSTGTSISGLNRNNIRRDLTNYTSNLVNYLKANHPGFGPNDVLGGHSIQPLRLNTQQRIVAIPYQTSGSQVWTYASLPNTFRTQITLSLPGPYTVRFNSSDIYGHRLTLAFSASLIPSIELDGVAKATGVAAANGAALVITSTITHAAYASTFADVTSSTQLKVTAGPNAVFAISNGWGQASRGMIDYHRRKLAQATAANPSNPNAEPVLGESLTMLGFTWLSQSTREQQLVDALAGTITVYHHGLGIAGMGVVGTSGATAPFVDLPINRLNFSQINNRLTSSTLTFSPAELAAFNTYNGIASVLESGSIEQIQSTPAVSTVKLLDTWAQSGKIFDINNNAVAGSSIAYSNTIRSQLHNNGYSWRDLCRIDALVGYSDPADCSTYGYAASNPTMRVIAPSAPQTVGLWSGVGFFQISQDNTAMGSIITSGLSGGYTTEPILVPIVIGNSSFAFTPDSFTTQSTSPAAPQSSNALAFGFTADPLNQVTGAYNYNHEDLTIGSLPFPYGLGFQRSYDSSSSISGPLGVGWTHNFNLSAQTSSDGFEGMAATSPENGAVAIAALYVLQDILTEQSASGTTGPEPLDRMIIAVEVERFLMDSLTKNVMQISQPGLVESYILQPNGTYTPPLGSAATVTQGGGKAIYTAKDGKVLTFDTSSNTNYVAGNILSWASPAGMNINFSYNGGLLSRVSNNLGRTLSLSYNGNRQIQSVTDSAGRSVSYSYSGGNLTGFADTMGNVTHLTYDASGTYDTAGHLTQIFYPSHPANAFLTNYYDSLGHVVRQIDGDGHVTLAYFAGTRTEVIDGAGDDHVSYFDQLGHMTSDEWFDSDYPNTPLITSYAYDGQGRLATKTLPEGNGFSYTYDQALNVLTETQSPKPSTPLPSRTRSWTFTCTIYSLPCTATDFTGNVTTYAYDTHGNLISVAQPAVNKYSVPAMAQPFTGYTYESHGLKTSQIDAEGTVTNFAYDGGIGNATVGNLTKITVDAGRQNLATQYSYDSVGNRTIMTDANGNHTAYLYNTQRLLTLITPPSASNAAVTNYSYDADGRVLQVSRPTGYSGWPNQVTSTSYTVAGQKSVVTDPSGYVTTYAYDSAGRVGSFTDGAGRKQLFQYTSRGQRHAIYDGNSHLIEWDLYSPNNLPAMRADGWGASDSQGKSHEVWYVMDGFDRLAQITYPDGSATRFSYTINNDRASMITRAGQMVSWTYDALHRPLAKKGDPNVTYDYDYTGRLLGAATPVVSGDASTGRWVFGYDTAGRLSYETSPSGGSLSYRYDAAGNRIGMTYPDGVSFTWTFDALNRQIGAPMYATDQFDALGRLTRRGLNSLPGTSANSVVENWAYSGSNTAGWNYNANNADLWTVSHQFLTPSTQLQFAYGYDQGHALNGQQTTATLSHPSSGGATSYGTPTNLDQLRNAPGGATIGYDTNGNLTSDGTYTYTYDNEGSGRIVTVSGSRQGAVSYKYDPLGRRYSKTVGGTTTVYLRGDGGREVGEYSSSGTLLRRLFYAAGSVAPYGAMGVGSSLTYLHPDALGSVVATTDQSGNVTWRGSYLPWGESLSTNLPTSGFGYAGYRYDPETNLYYANARYYSPTLGRFLEPDPIGQDGGINIYAYTGNDPINFTDPLGLCAGAGCGNANPATQLIPQNDAITPVYPVETLIGIATGGSVVRSALGAIVNQFLPNPVSNAAASSAPDFVVSPNGTAYPVPAGAQGPTPVINPAGNQTGVAFTGGSGGANGQVSTIRLMDPTPPRGNSPGYPNGYIVYQNNSSPTPQLVDPITGQTTSRALGHFPVQ